MQCKGTPPTQRPVISWFPGSQGGRAPLDFHGLWRWSFPEIFDAYPQSFWQPVWRDSFFSLGPIKKTKRFQGCSFGPKNQSRQSQSLGFHLYLHPVWYHLWRLCFGKCTGVKPATLWEPKWAPPMHSPSPRNKALLRDYYYEPMVPMMIHSHQAPFWKTNHLKKLCFV